MFFFSCPQERANIINSRLNEETSALAKKQAAFQRNQRDNDANAEEEFEIFCSEAMFRIQVKLKVCRCISGAEHCALRAVVRSHPRTTVAAANMESIAQGLVFGVSTF